MISTKNSGQQKQKKLDSNDSLVSSDSNLAVTVHIAASSVQNAYGYPIVVEIKYCRKQ